MLFLLAYGRRYVLGLLGLFDDLERRQLRSPGRSSAPAGAARTSSCTLAHALVNGVVFGVVCWLLDLAAPLSLGVAVAVMTAIPLIGIVVGGVPALLLAFGSSGWAVGVTVPLCSSPAGGRGACVRPFVDGRSVRVGTTVAIVVALIAFDLYGVGGAMCAVALAAIALAALDVYGGASRRGVVGRRQE